MLSLFALLVNANWHGAAENAERENDKPPKSQGVKMQDMKMQDLKCWTRK